MLDEFFLINLKNNEWYEFKLNNEFIKIIIG
jgi:hypothetical protein